MSSDESFLEWQRGKAPSCGVKGVVFLGFWRLIFQIWLSLVGSPSSEFQHKVEE